MRRDKPVQANTKRGTPFGVPRVRPAALRAALYTNSRLKKGKKGPPARGAAPKGLGLTARER